MKNLKKIIHITDSIPFHNGGVSDYSYLISKGLKEKFDIETFFVTCNAFTDYDTSIFNNITNIYKEKNLYATVKNIINNNFRNDEKIDIILEYVPHAYQKRGCPFWLLSELKKIKKNIPNINLITMFHELYATSSNPKTSTFWLQGVQKFITKNIYILSDYTFTNTLKYKNELKQWKDKEVIAMPVFSNIGESDELISFYDRKNYAIVFGSIGKRQKVYDEKEALLKWMKRLNIEKIIDVGSGEPNIQELPVEIEFKGRMESKNIIFLIQNIKYGFVNNGNGGAMEKSGIYASYIANNLCTIVLNSYQGESIYESNQDYLFDLSKIDDKSYSIVSSSKNKYKSNSCLNIHLNKFYDRLLKDIAIKTKILIYTPYFYPSMGGLETVTDTLAIELDKKGLEVEVYTPFVLGKEKEIERQYKITRANDTKLLLSSVKNCDVFIHNSISLRAILPLLIYKRKWFVVHHMILANMTIKNKILSFLKKFISKFAKNIAVSNFMANYYGNNSKVIPNPVTIDFNAEVFNIKKTKEFVFFGRLIKDKGAHLAIKALSHIKNDSILTIIGSGPEENNLKNLVKELNLNNRVLFRGRLNGNDLFNEIKKHKVALVPSVWTEPFGVVVLEAYSCGCNIVASDIGGLPDAVGDCGILVKANDIDSLKIGMEKALLENIDIERVKKHLYKHSGSFIAEQFINEFKKGNE